MTPKVAKVPILDPFKIIGIDQDATDEEVKRAKRSEPSTKSTTEGSSTNPGACEAESGQSKSKVHHPTEPSVPRRSPHGLWHVFFGNLPLQNETNIFILISVLDIFATYALLRFGGHEANPIANFFLSRWNVQGMVFFKMTLVAFVSIISQIIARRNLARASQVLILGTVIVTAVVLYSVTLLARNIH